MLNNIRDGIHKLADIKIVDILDEDGYDFILDLSCLYIGDSKSTKEYYTIIDLSEVHKIMQCSNVQVFFMLRYFVYLMFSCYKIKNDSGYTGIGYDSIESMHDFLGYDDNSIMKYNDLLTDLQLIYIYKSKDAYLDNDGNYINISNTYGRFKDKDTVITAGIEHEQKYGVKYAKTIKEKKRLIGNKTRSASQKYNALCCGKEYSESELKDIYTALKAYNSKQQDESKKKNLCIFEELRCQPLRNH
jgi:hypothetical protein